MKKLILIIALLGSTAFADYIPTKTDRGMLGVCNAHIYNYIDTYEAEYDLYYAGLMDGAIEMAIVSHIFSNTDYIKSNIRDIMVHVYKKTKKDKNVNVIGFQKTFNFNVYTSTKLK